MRNVPSWSRFVCLLGLLAVASPALAGGNASQPLEKKPLSCAKTQLIVEPPCFGIGCQECNSFTSCGSPTFSGSFVRQKDNGACVYQCQESSECTTTICCPDTGCDSDTFTQTRDFRVRALGYPMGGCPQDQITINNFSRLGGYDD